MRTYHYSVRIGRGKTTFPTVALGSLRESLAFFWKGRGVQFPWLSISQTYLSALFSCQRTDGHNQSRYKLEAFNIKV
ncbi:transposase [Clostridioides difficile]|nr:transposase [Clostridioides difficile]